MTGGFRPVADVFAACPKRRLCSDCRRSPLLGLRSVSDSKPTFSLAVGDARSVSNAR